MAEAALLRHAMLLQRVGTVDEDERDAMELASLGVPGSLLEVVTEVVPKKDDKEKSATTTATTASLDVVSQAKMKWFEEWAEQCRVTCTRGYAFEDEDDDMTNVDWLYAPHDVPMGEIVLTEDDGKDFYYIFFFCTHLSDIISCFIFVLNIEYRLLFFPDFLNRFCFCKSLMLRFLKVKILIVM